MGRPFPFNRRAYWNIKRKKIRNFNAIIDSFFAKQSVINITKCGAIFNALKLLYKVFFRPLEMGAHRGYANLARQV